MTIGGRPVVEYMQFSSTSSYGMSFLITFRPPKSTKNTRLTVKNVLTLTRPTNFALKYVTVLAF